VNPEADQARGEFLRRLTQERALSPHTRAAYQRDLAALAAWCDRQGLDQWTGIDHGHVRTFSAHSHAGGLGSRSIQRRLSAVRSFYTFLQREQLCAHNPAADVRAPKGPRKLPRTLDADLMQRVLESPAADAAPPDLLDLRDRAIMELLYSSGLRLAELAGLSLAGLDLKDRTVTVTGKGGRTRIVPVGSMAVTVLGQWLRERTQLAAPGELAVFVGRNGSRLGARAIQLRLAAFARRHGLPVRLHPHLFRHSFASHLLESSHDLRGVQELLGHANLSTTQIYTHLDFQHLAHIYDQAHPRARRRRGD
jgi:integrase/recombinase XerC